MGLESEGGIHQEDVVKAMEGCIKERYKVRPIPLHLLLYMWIDFSKVFQQSSIVAVLSQASLFFQFNPESPVSPQDEGYRSNPSLPDQTYCLVYVLPADKISLTVHNDDDNDDDEVTKKIKYIKNKANELGEYKSKKMSEIFIIFIIAKSKISFMRLNDIVPRFIITSVTVWICFVTKYKSMF